MLGHGQGADYAPLRAIPHDIDLARMGRARYARVQAALARQDVDALVLLKAGNARYVSGAETPMAEASREYAFPTVALVLRGAPHPWVLTAYPGAAPPALPTESILPPELPETGAGATRLVAQVQRLLRPAGRGRIGFDGLSLAVRSTLAEAMPAAEIIDAERVMGEARLVKTADEIACLKHVEWLNEAAMYAVLPEFGPGLREVELNAAFFQRLAEVGVAYPYVDGTWRVTARTRAEATFACHFDIPYSGLTSDQIIREGDLVVIDNGVIWEGYVSDFGRTWYAGTGTKPSPRQKDLFKKWRELFLAMLEVCRPGRSSAELPPVVRATAQKLGLDYWPSYASICHGIGLYGADPPFVGALAAMDVDNPIPFEPGMVLALEPYVWEDGVGGYRSEDSFVITVQGPEIFSRFPYGPLAD
jgi:Xaa-Pro aminopeptidase